MHRFALPTSLLMLAVAVSVAKADPIDLKTIARDLTFIGTQAQKTVLSLTPGSFPRSGGDTGKWKTVAATDWTSGFFPGELWLLYQATGSQQWLAKAKSWTAPLASQASRTDTHDVGFIIGESFGNGYRLTGDPTYKSEILAAAASLTARYNPAVGAVRSWSFGPWKFPVIVDNMMTLGPLEWGAKASGGNPAWGADATTHANTTIAHLVRSDGSTFQLGDFDPTTGAFIANYVYAGLSLNSTWSRGKSWGLYGFVQAYQATGNASFLTTAEKIANFYFSRLPADYVPYWDFSAPASPTTPIDTSSAAIAADGLVMLSTVAKTAQQRATYLTEAEDILASLSANFLAPSTGEAVLNDGSGGGHSEVDTALIYGDYFFTEALLRLQGVLEGKPGWTLYDSATAPHVVSMSLLNASDPVPEPSTWAMLLLGFGGLGFASRRTVARRGG